MGLLIPGAGFLLVSDGQSVALEGRPRWDLNAETTTVMEVNADLTVSVILRKRTANVGEAKHTNGAT